MTAPPTSAPAVVIVVPAHNESRYLPTCLASVRLASEHAERQGAVSWVKVVVVAHLCRDDTANVARAGLPTRQSGEVLEFDLPASVGRVRDLGARVGLAASAFPDCETWIFSTDADTTVSPDWISRSLAEADSAGAVAVVGVAVLDRWRGHPASQPRYDEILTAKMRFDDPVHAHDHVYGANLAVRADAYLGVGGFPRCGHGEDQRLVDALAGADYPILRTRAVEVVTSGRLDGRATGGLATLLRSMDEQDLTPEAVDGAAHRPRSMAAQEWDAAS